MLVLAGCSLAVLWQLLQPRLPQGMPRLTPALQRRLWQLLRDEASQLSFSSEELMQAARCVAAATAAATAAALLVCCAQHSRRCHWAASLPASSCNTQRQRALLCSGILLEGQQRGGAAQNSTRLRQQIFVGSPGLRGFHGVRCNCNWFVAAVFSPSCCCGVQGGC